MKLTIEFDENILAAAIVAAMGGTAKPAKASKAEKQTEAAGDTPSGVDALLDEVNELHDELKAELDADDLKELLSEFGGKTLKTVLKKVGEDEEVLQELVGVMKEELEGKGGEGGDEEVDRTADEVKKLAQAVQKKIGKDDLADILEKYEIKKVAKIKDLEQDDLNDLFDDLTEEMED